MAIDGLYHWNCVNCSKATMLVWSTRHFHLHCTYIHYFTGKVLTLFLVIDPDFFLLGDWAGLSYPIFVAWICSKCSRDLWSDKKFSLWRKTNKSFPGLRVVSKSAENFIEANRTSRSSECWMKTRMSSHRPISRIRIKTWGKSCDLLIRTYYIIYIYTPSAPQSYRGFYGK